MDCLLAELFVLRHYWLDWHFWVLDPNKDPKDSSKNK